MNLSRLSQLAGFCSWVVVPLVIGGCKSTDDVAGDTPRAEFSGPIAPAAYAQMVGDTNFQRIRSESLASGYSIESGNLLGRDASIGTLILVRSPSGEITGIVDRPGKRGTFHVGVDGKQRFRQSEATDFKNMKDTEAPASPDPFPPEHAASPESEVPQFIDVLAGYSRDAVEKLAEDPIAYAYAMLETVNLNIDNSDAGAVKLRLAGIRIHEVDYNTSSEGLREWENLLSPLRPQYHHDVNMAIANYDSSAGGRAFRPGYTSVNGWGGTTVFRHEFAHNVGGLHCNSDQIDDYRFGFNNGKSATALCDNVNPYYSNPSKQDAHGLPLGNAKTADMARLFRERTTAMAKYQGAFNGERLMFVALGAANEARLKIPLKGQNTGIVAVSPAVGPTALATQGVEGYTELKVQLRGDNYIARSVKFRGQRNIGSCGRKVMNAGTACGVGGGNIYFYLHFDPADNPDLPPGLYNGKLVLKALDYHVPEAEWSPLIQVSITIQKK